MMATFFPFAETLRSPYCKRANTWPLPVSFDSDARDKAGAHGDEGLWPCGRNEPSIQMGIDPLLERLKEGGHKLPRAVVDEVPLVVEHLGDTTEIDLGLLHHLNI